MILYLLRHGDAVRNLEAHDSERPLSDLGRRQAAATASFLREMGLRIELILTSPLVRAQETTAAIREGIGSATVRTTEHLTSSSDPRHVIRDLSGLSNESVLLVGHEPHLSTLISVLIGGSERGRVLMKPCSLACVSAPSPLERDRGLLQWLIHAEHMMRT